MGRGLAILAVFAVVIGVSVYCAPFKLRSATDGPRAAIVERNEERVAATADAEPAQETLDSRVGQPTVPALRKAETSTSESRHERVLATPPIPATPLAALPEKAIPGFPLKPQKELSNDQIASIMKQAKYLRSEGQLIESRDLLSDTYFNNRLTVEQKSRLAEELQPLAWEILRSPSTLEDGQLYEVQAGDVLIKIAKHFYVPPEYVMRLNGLKNARTIRPGQKLKLVQGPFDVLADVSAFEIAVLRRGKFVRRFAIGIGRSDTPTPLGLFKVSTKLEKPTYYPPPSDSDHRRPIPAGHPDNPLGTRWIEIGLGYGIHGTIDPNSIGKETSRGCIRMRNEDVEELYDMVTEGSRVLIR
jgi:LysM repeat protein